MIFRGLLFLTLCVFSVSANAEMPEMIDYPSVKIQTLEKSTARTDTLEAKVGETVQFGSLYIKVQSCRKAGPLDKPESAAFLQVWEIPINAQKSEWIFSGWMFASSPALSAMDHPVYDVWVLDCVGGQQAAPQANQVTIEGETQIIEDTPEVEETKGVEENQNIKEDNVLESEGSTSVQSNNKNNNQAVLPLEAPSAKKPITAEDLNAQALDALQ